MAEATNNTTEKTTTKKKIKEKGVPFSYRPKKWVSDACQYIAKIESDRMGINLPLQELFKGIFEEGVKPFFEKRGYPVNEDGWEKLWEDLLKNAVAEINE